jgi:pentatricopeptide repeat protein
MAAEDGTDAAPSLFPPTSFFPPEATAARLHTRPRPAVTEASAAMKRPAKGVKKSHKPTRGKAPGGRVYEVAQAILNAPAGGVAAVIRDALNDKEAPIRRDPRAFTMFSTRCRKSGAWEKCVEIFDAMREQGVETNTIVYNATMSACSKGGAWERALELFDDMPGLGHERSTITYNVAMSACMRGGDWERALELFDAMPDEGLERDAVSVNTAMAAAEAGGDSERLRALAGGGAAAKEERKEDDADDESDESDASEDDDSDSGENDAARSDSDETRLESEPRLGPKQPKPRLARRSPSPPPAEEDPATRERRLKAERRDARREKFEAKRRARKAARNARPWMSGEDAPGEDAGAKPKARAKDDAATRAKRKEWGGNPLEWVDDDEGVKRRKRGQAESSENEDDPYDDGLPPITGPSVFDADEREAKTLLNAKDDGDDFWRDDVF